MQQRCLGSNSCHPFIGRKGRRRRTQMCPTQMLACQKRFAVGSAPRADRRIAPEGGPHPVAAANLHLPQGRRVLTPPPEGKRPPRGISSALCSHFASWAARGAPVLPQTIRRRRRRARPTVGAIQLRRFGAGVGELGASELPQLVGDARVCLGRLPVGEYEHEAARRRLGDLS